MTRSDLPAELTAEQLRHLDFRTLRQLSRPGNGVLTEDEQRRFDAALAALREETTSLVESSLQRAGRGGPANLDPAMRRSYQRAQQRLAAQADRARKRLPDLGPEPVSGPAPDPAPSPAPDFASDPVASAVDDPADADHVGDDEVSPNSLEEEVAQTSDTLDMLERIASLQQQLLDHQQTQVLSETRGFFFAFLVSVAVIVAGVAPLVEAEPHDRLVIVVWTVVATAAAGLAYALVRAVQARK
ncbi:hypothetical protein [uncultured Jatrophihabitans sp.]|uniref:hypothetical protein n=1 Tax=uncultured Jatrophihabitans sp. TaxID=1610747 RepID=UPI0035CAD494